MDGHRPVRRVQNPAYRPAHRTGLRRCTEMVLDLLFRCSVVDSPLPSFARVRGQTRVRFADQALARRRRLPNDRRCRAHVSHICSQSTVSTQCWQPRHETGSGAGSSRRRTRRCRADVLAHTPSVCGSSSAEARHCSVTGHRSQMALAPAEGSPLLGKKDSTPNPRHRAERCHAGREPNRSSRRLPTSARSSGPPPRKLTSWATFGTVPA